MDAQNFVRYSQEQPATALISLFVLWKLVIFAVAISSPGPGYDTSTSLLFSEWAPAISDPGPIDTPTSLPRVLKFARWDVIYFAPIARRGYLFEQEWAFGWGHTQFLAAAAKVMPPCQHNESSHLVSVGISLSHLLHLMSVLVLYSYGRLLCGRTSTIPFLAASFHIFSPAGIFLSAPYAEALCSFLSFLGYYLYTHSVVQYSDGRIVTSNAFVAAAGLVFGLSVTVRSNGSLNGALFLYEAFLLLSELRHSFHASIISRLLSVVLGGLCIAVGAVLPQYLAYSEYCNLGADIRPWCTSHIPSIYRWVQGHYWNVGFLRYWTVSNIPLFLLAAPMLTILFVSSFDCVRGTVTLTSWKMAAAGTPGLRNQNDLLRQAALPQLLLGTTAFTTFHVQVITRLASGSPLWYIWLAQQFLTSAGKHRQHKKGWLEGTSRWMIIYALIQGGLYAAFLPPA